MLVSACLAGCIAKPHGPRSAWDTHAANCQAEQCQTDKRDGKLNARWETRDQLHQLPLDLNEGNKCEIFAIYLVRHVNHLKNLETESNI